jgi:hypothetical protein
MCCTIGNATWVIFGLIVALSFTLLGWHNWSVLPPSPTATLLIILNLLTILTSTLVLHLGFFGRLLSLYKRNFQRVEFITSRLHNLQLQDLDSWWNFRNHVLNDDLALDYDIGGLAVSATFVINVMVFLTVVVQTYREGFQAILEPPGSYCAYACLYITLCLLKIFTLATNTFEEQFRHVHELQKISNEILLKSNSYASFINLENASTAAHNHSNLPKNDSSDSLVPLGLCVEDGDFYLDSLDASKKSQQSSTILSLAQQPASPPRSINKVMLKRQNSGSGASYQASQSHSLSLAVDMTAVDGAASSSSNNFYDIESFSQPTSPRRHGSSLMLDKTGASLTTPASSSSAAIPMTTTTTTLSAMQQQQQAAVVSNPLVRQPSINISIQRSNELTASGESTRQTVADMVSQIR